jgi:Fe-S-cluster containining protein
MSDSTRRSELAESVRLCRREEFLAALGAIYKEADRRIASGGSACLGGGACCKFDLAGHRLYVTAGELALLALEPPPEGIMTNGAAPPPGESIPPSASLRDAAEQGSPSEVASRIPMRCPYQRRDRCLARGRRPLGCRVYFCRAGAGALSDLYEEFHRRLRELHERHAVPYRYVELTAGLRELGVGGGDR